MKAPGITKGKFNIWDLLIIFLIMGVLVSNYIWLKKDEWPVYSHELNGLTPAVQVYRELVGMGNTYTIYDKILGRYHGNFAYPPLSFLVVVIFYFLFGLQGQMVIMVNSLYITLALVCVYLIGKHMFNKPTGLLAAFILSSFPGFIIFSREYWIEFGLIAYVALDLFFILKLYFFESRKYSILLGLSLALSFFHKYEFFAFILGPLLLVIFKSGILSDILKGKSSSRLINLILTFTIPIILTSFWWIPYGKGILERGLLVLSHNENIQKIVNFSYRQSVFSFESFATYLHIFTSLLGQVYFVLFLSSIFFLIIRLTLKDKKRFYILLLISYFLIAYLTFTFLVTKGESHILSILPAMALLISAGIYFLKNTILRIVLVTLLFVYGFNLHLNPFYSDNIFNSLNNHKLKFLRCVLRREISPFSPIRKEPLEVTIKEISEYIRADSFGKKYPGILAIYRRDAFKNCTFEYYNLINDNKLRFSACYHLMQDVSETDYVIIEQPEGKSVSELLSEYYFSPKGENSVEGFKQTFMNSFNNFVLIKIYKIPKENTSILIYKKKPAS